LSIPHIIVLGPVPVWKCGLPNEVLRYFVMHHALIPARSLQRVYQLWNDTQMRSAIVDLGAEYISAWEAMCDADGCLTRLGEKPEDIIASDAHHLTENGSKFLIESIKDKIAPVGAPRCGSVCCTSSDIARRFVCFRRVRSISVLSGPTAASARVCG